MTFKEYQDSSRQTAIYPKEMGIVYCLMGLMGEAGELSNKIKKRYRDGDGQVLGEEKKQLSGELGDILWYLASLSHELGLDLGTIAEENIDKLLSRKERGVLGGSGDNR
jgi:NTP pyrophosphatase (non-canonical NTP hydrolase)